MTINAENKGGDEKFSLEAFLFHTSVRAKIICLNFRAFQEHRVSLMCRCHYPFSLSYILFSYINIKAKSALAAYPQGLQIGGGITSSNASEWLSYGASHVIVTSFVFHNGQIDFDRLNQLVQQIGKDRLVLDLSCRRKAGDKTGPYYVVTDRWQTYTDVAVNEETLKMLGSYCAEFLVHGVENEGKRCGILEDLVQLLGKYSPVPVTYAGGVQGLEDLDRVKILGNGNVDLTIGSALDCFGGDIKYDDVVAWHKREN